MTQVLTEITAETPEDAAMAIASSCTEDGQNEPEPYLTIQPPSGWSAINLLEVWRYRELVWFFTLRDVKKRYKQTLLGPLWIIVVPLLSSGLFSLIFGALAGLPSAGIPYPVFVFAGMLVWNLFSKAFSASSTSLMSNQRLITKVYFPRMIIPISASVGGLLDFILGFGVLIVLMLMTGLTPTWAVLTIPLFMFLTIVVGLAIGLWISALSVRFRDVGYASTFLTTVGMWMTPVAYSSEVVFNNERLPESIRGVVEVLYQLNPMYVVVEGFRWSMLGHASGAPTALSALSVGLTFLFLLAGMMVFRRCEHTFADVL